MSRPKLNPTFFDCECFRHVDGQALWCVVFKWIDRDGKARTKVIDSYRDRDAVGTLRNLISQLVAVRTRQLVGYNCQSYDLPLLARILSPQPGDVKQYSDDLVSDLIPPWREKLWSGTIPPQFTLDLAERVGLIWNAGLKKHVLKNSLKMAAALIGYPKLQELPYDPSNPVTSEQWAEIVAYCVNDVGATEAVFEYFSPQYQALAYLYDLVGVNVMGLSNAKAAEEAFRKGVFNEVGAWPEAYTQAEWPERYQIPIPAGLPHVRNPQIVEWIEKARRAEIPSDGRKGDENSEEIKLFTQTFDHCGIKVSLGRGGVHSDHDGQPPRLIKSDEHNQIVYLDVTSYYPTILLNHDIPMGKGLTRTVGPKVYRKFYDNRLATKARSKDKTLSAEERQAAKIADGCLKIVLNGLYGRLGFENSVLNSPGGNNSITIAGEVGLLALMERVTDVGVSIAQVNTDGLILVCPRDRLDDLKLATDLWQAEMKVSLDIDYVPSVLIGDCNNWVAEDKDGSLSGKGHWRLSSTPDRQQEQYPPVVIRAVYKALLDGTPPEKTIREHLRAAKADAADRTKSDKERLAKFMDFLWIHKAGGKLSVDTPDGNQEFKYLRYYAATYGSPFQLVSSTKKDKEAKDRDAAYESESEGSVSKNRPENIGLCLDLPDNVPNDISVLFYTGEARRLLREFNLPFDAHELSGKAAELHREYGLIPAPALMGKVTENGILHDFGPETLALSRVDWPNVRTLKVYAGRTPGNVPNASPVVALDIDKPELWATFLTDDERAKLAALNPLTVTKGCTPEDVLAGRSNGKILFRFTNAKIPLFTDWGKPKRTALMNVSGAEFFNGGSNKTIVAVWGETKVSGVRYDTQGALGELPDWLAKKIKVATDSAKETKSASPGTRSRKKGQAEDAVLPDEPNWGNVLDYLGQCDERFHAGLKYKSERRNVTNDDGSVDQRFAIRFRCPGHGARNSSARDAEIFLDRKDGWPVFDCKHDTCSLEDHVREWIKEQQNPDRPLDPDDEPDDPAPTDPQPDEASSEPAFNLNAPSADEPTQPFSEAASDDGSDETFFNSLLELIDGKPGSGKTERAVWKAIKNARKGIKTAFIAPNKTLLTNFRDRLLAKAPELRDRIGPMFDPSETTVRETTEDVAGIEELAGTTKLTYQDTLLVALECHESLKRRGFSIFARRFWVQLFERKAKGERWCLIIDEADAFVRSLHETYPLSVRISVDDGGLNAKTRFPVHRQDECPASKHLSDKRQISCENCTRFDTTGVRYHKSIFSTDIVEPPTFKPLRSTSDPVVQCDDQGDVLSLNLNDFTIGEMARIDGWCTLQQVIQYNGVNIDKDARERIHPRLWQGEQMSTPDGAEPADQVWMNIVTSMLTPTIRTYYPVMLESGNQVTREMVMEYARRYRSDLFQFPVRPCDSPVLSGIDSMPLMLLRKAIENGIEVSMMSGTWPTAVREAINEIFPAEMQDWKPLPTRNTTIGALAVVTVWNPEPKFRPRLGQIAPNWLLPLKDIKTGFEEESNLKCLFVAPSVKSVDKLTEGLWGSPQIDFDYRIPEGSKARFGRSSGLNGNELVLLASAHHNPVRGMDGKGFLMVVDDAGASRLAADAILWTPRPGETWQSVVDLAAAEEHETRLVQLYARILRGKEDKNGVVISLNCPPAKAEEFIQSENVTSRTKTALTTNYLHVCKNIFTDAFRWIQNGGEWVNTAEFRPSPTQAKAAARKSAALTAERDKVAEITMRAHEAKSAKANKREFKRTHNTGRYPGLNAIIDKIFDGS